MIHKRKPGTAREKWLDFRRARITAVVAAVAERARKIRPGIRISAAVFGNWPADHGGQVRHLILGPDAKLKPEHRGDFLGGVTVLTGKAKTRTAGSDQLKQVDLLAVPYYAWDNRSGGEMAVWLPEAPRLARPLARPLARTTGPRRGGRSIRSGGRTTVKAGAGNTAWKSVWKPVEVVVERGRVVDGNPGSR